MMLKLKKIIKIIFINLILIISLLLILDYFLYKNIVEGEINENTKFHYRLFNPRVYLTELNLFGREINKSKNCNSSTPIILFGCSYAYGMHLSNQQTFAFKLSKLLKKPVINKAILAGSIQHMYYLSSNEEFYKMTPKSNNIIYILIEDQYRRILLYTFLRYQNFLYLHYSRKNNDLIMDNYKNPIKNLIKSLYVSKYINHIYVHNYVNNEKNAEKLTDLELLYFEKTRANFEKHWGKVNFNILIYTNFKYSDILKDKLEKAGFNVIMVEDLTNEDIKSTKYMLPDIHPNEAAWDLLTPLIAKKLVIK